MMSTDIRPVMIQWDADDPAGDPYEAVSVGWLVYEDEDIIQYSPTVARMEDDEDEEWSAAVSLLEIKKNLVTRMEDIG